MPADRAAATKPDKGLWRIPADGGSEQKIIDSLSTPWNYQVTEEGIYYISGEVPNVSISFLRFATGETQTLAKLDKHYGWGMSVSPDRRTILFTQLDRDAIDLELVENFR